MIEYLIVMLESRAPSFCHYELGKEEARHTKSTFIREECLRDAIAFAADNKLRITFLLGTRSIPKNIERLLDTVEHAKIVPFTAWSRYPEGVALMDPSDCTSDQLTKHGVPRHIILRVARRDIRQIRRIVTRLLRETTRIDLVMSHVDQISEREVVTYRRQLESTVQLLVQGFLFHRPIEFSSVTDRLFLRDMRNCEAGTRHITLAANGNLYICPGFYETGGSTEIGTLYSEIVIPDRRLLDRSFSPVCSACDAFQCKRCVYLNWRLTGEVNIPSHEQCALAHAERQTTRRLFKEATAQGVEFSPVLCIPEIEYNDPLDLLMKKSRHVVSTRGTLNRIEDRIQFRTLQKLGSHA